ncbi:MAG: hypothetical protein NVS3B1_12720 [Marmoricola sp.]
MAETDLPSPINKPHVDESDPAAFFGDAPDVPEPTLTGDGSIAPPEEKSEIEVEREKVLSGLREQQESAGAQEPPPAPEHRPTPAEGLQAPGGEPPAPPAAQTPPASPPARTARGTADLPRTYAVLREVELGAPMLKALLDEIENGGKPRTAFLTLEAAHPGRSPKQVAKDVFKKHHKRLGVGLRDQPPLVLFAIADSSWQRMPVSVKPRVIDDNIEID